MSITVGQLRAARGLIGWSQTDLAEKSGVSRPTIADFEAGKREPYPRTIETLRAALEAAGVVFVDENGHGPGVRLKKGYDPEAAEDAADIALFDERVALEEAREKAGKRPKARPTRPKNTSDAG
jgi:transcriptional regulator with XRE-family HTH domain